MRTLNEFIPKRLNKVQLDLLLEGVGYNYYFPTEFYYNLVDMVCYHKFDSRLNCIVKNDEVSQFLKLLPNNLFDFYNNEKVHIAALLILQSLATKVNFKMIEENQVLQSLDNIIGNNYILQLSQESTDFLECNINLDIAKVIKLCKNIFDNQLIKVPQQKFSHSINFIDFLKARKSHFKKPDFELKLIKKDFHYYKDQNKVKTNEIIFVVDYSSSMQTENILSVIKAFQLYLIENEFTIKFIRFVGDEFNVIQLDTKKEKIDCFSKEEFFTTNCNYNSLFTYLNNNFKSKQVLLITDGDDFISVKKLNFKLNCVNLRNYNSILEYMCKTTNGNYNFIN